MKILIYSFNDKIGDGLQKVSFLQEIKRIYPNSHITYTTTNTTTLKDKLNPLVKNCINEFIENNNITSSIKNLFKKNKIFENKYFDLIIDLQKVVIRTICLKKISHGKFFSASANFLFSDFKNTQKYRFKNIYIERLYFNILSIINGEEINNIPNIEVPKLDKSSKIIKSETRKNIGIAPGAGSQTRIWDFNNYITVAEYLKKMGFNIYFFLGPDEKHLLKKCVDKNFICPEWKSGKLVSNDITFTMNLAKKMSFLLCNDGGTSWMFEFSGVKTLKIFDVTNENKFARPGFCKTIQVKDYGYTIKNFPVSIYLEILDNYISEIN